MIRPVEGWPCRLIGGPFDGDDGYIQEPEPPNRIYATGCPCPPGRYCRAGGVHWYVTAEVALRETGQPGAPYVQHGQQDDGVFAYVWTNLLDGERERLVATRRELAPA